MFGKFVARGKWLDCRDRSAPEAGGKPGLLSRAHNITENGAAGFYLFGSQRFWRARPTIDNSGISGFVQFGRNNSEPLPMNEDFGTGYRIRSDSKPGQRFHRRWILHGRHA